MPQSCSICSGFMYDWLMLPLNESDEFYPFLRPVSFRRSVPTLVKEISNFFTALTPLTQFMIMKKKLGISSTLFEKFGINRYNKNIQTTIVQGISILESVKGMDLEYRISGIIALLEDNACFRSHSVMIEWLGYTLQTLWETLPDLHSEHLREKPCSYGGPALGLKSFDIAPMVVEKTEEQKEFDSLYN